jgi:hypothetical protein
MNKQTIFNSLPLLGSKSPDKVKSYPKVSKVDGNKPIKGLRKVSLKRGKEKKEQGTEKPLFLKLYRESAKVSELTGKKLLSPSHPQFYCQFLHVLGKGVYPELRLCERNIMLALPEEHDFQNRYPAFNERKIELMKMVKQNG